MCLSFTHSSQLNAFVLNNILSSLVNPVDLVYSVALTFICSAML